MGSIAEPPCIQLFDGYALYYRRFPEICQPEKNRELWKVGFGCGVERDCSLWNGSWKIFSRWVVKIRAAGEIKSFSVQQFFKNAAEVWASSPRLRSKLYLQQVFPAAIAFFEAVKFKQSWIMRIKAANSDKATGQLQHAGRQKQGWNPLLPDAEDRFP